MQKSLLCVFILLFAELSFAKTVGARSSTYGYTRTSSSRSMVGGYWLMSRSGSNCGSYSSSNCNTYGTRNCGANQNCGAKSSKGEEVERLVAYPDGKCSDRGCVEVSSQSDCSYWAGVTGDTTSLERNIAGLDTCNRGAAARCFRENTDIQWCESIPSNAYNQCRPNEQCLCKCIVGEEDSSADVGLILGITFGLLFGCCLLVGCWMHLSKKAKLQKEAAWNGTY